MKRPNTVVVVFVLATAAFVGSLSNAVEGQGGVSDAPAGFELRSNGFAEEFCENQARLTDSRNSPPIPDEECNFDAALEEFIGPETIPDGLGPIFNAAGCGDCHLTPITGGSSQIMEKRAGFFNGSIFVDHPGGSLIHDRATDVRIQEHTIPASTNVTALRGSLSVLGDGFVEAISNNTLSAIANAQSSSVRGLVVQVPVLEAEGNLRAGRFGWKNQHASLVSFSADAYVNEMGITSPLQPDEPTSNGNSVAAFDTAPAGRPGDVDDEGVDVELFALFMRSTLAPPRDSGRANTNDARAGAALFSQIGCAQCHTPEIVTASPGTQINGGALRVAGKLGNKRIKPFGDFLLHDIGSGDGIVQNGGQATRNRVRTVPLWGLRARSRFMHDSLSFSVNDAIQRHGNQAAGTRAAFNGLSSSNRSRIIEFLLSL
jgi:CxxC motif-containing protein (DUF1111 family)